MGSELFVSPRADRRSFSPKDTSAHSTVDVSISRVGLFMVAFSLSLITVSLVESNQEDPSMDIENDNVTQFLRENIETIRNGSYVYGSDSKYAAIQSGVIDSWLAAVNSGMQRYNYGDSGNNFCWKRKEIPRNETMHSLFRSSQLFIGVQVPIRVSILCSLLHRILIIMATLSLYTRGKSMWINAAVITESLHLVAIFTVFTLHVGQDYQLLATVAIYEWLFVAMTLASYVLDSIDGRSMNLVVDVFTEDSF